MALKINLNKNKQDAKQAKEQKKKKREESKTIRCVKDNNYAIYKNALVFKKNTTLYYLLDLFNYEMYEMDSIEEHITNLYNTMQSLSSTVGSNLKFSVFRFQNIISSAKYYEELIETVSKWNSNFTPSQDFKKNMDYLNRAYCVLAINVDNVGEKELYDMTFKEMGAYWVGKLADAFASFNQTNIDKNAIDKQGERILGVLSRCARPVNEKFLLDVLVKRFFPSYTLITRDSDLSFNKGVLSYLQQIFTPKFSYFEMTNSGVEVFGANAQKSYGCVIDLIEFPQVILSENFNLCHDGMVVNCKCLSKENAKVKFKRKRADIRFERESAEQVGYGDVNMEIDDLEDLANKGVEESQAGTVLCEADIHILLTAPSATELKAKRSQLITTLKDYDVVATFNPNQAKAYVDSFIKLRPEKYGFMMDMRYALSFQLNSGVAFGDEGDPNFTSPVIGRGLSKYEAIDR